MKAYIINLDKDVERWNTIEARCNIIGLQYERISGILGKKLNDKEIETYTGNSFICKNFCPLPALGCALSHLKAWKRIIDSDDPYGIVFEDDAYFDDNFIQETNRIMTEKIPRDYGMVFLGCFGRCDYNKSYPVISKLYTSVLKTNKHKIINDEVYVPEFPLGLHGYILSKSCALFLYEKINKNIKSHIDFQITTLLASQEKYKVYALKNNLVNQVVDTQTSNNIQHDIPKMLYKPFEKYIDTDGTSLNYMFGVPAFVVYDIPINCAILIFFLLGFISYQIHPGAFIGALIILNTLELNGMFSYNTINIISYIFVMCIGALLSYLLHTMPKRIR